jgi:hypothetical protein
VRANRFNGLVCRLGNEKKGKVKQGKGKGIYAYISPIWGAAPTHPIVTIFGMFSGLADIINCAKFQNDRSRGFCWVGA